MMMRRQDAEAITTLVTSLRPDWDPNGVLAALRKLRDRELPDVIRASVNAATDKTNRTPAVISMAGPHWIATTRDTPQPPRLNDRCRTHFGPAHNCPGCRADAIARPDETPEPDPTDAHASRRALCR